MSAQERIRVLESVKNRLGTITDKATWPARVPLGKHADFEGMIVHCNDITSIGSPQSSDAQLMSAKEAVQKIERELRELSSRPAADEREHAVRIDSQLEQWKTDETNEDGLPIYDIHEELPNNLSDGSQRPKAVASVPLHARHASHVSAKRSPEEVLSPSTLQILDELEREEEAAQQVEEDAKLVDTADARIADTTEARSKMTSKGFMQTAKRGFLLQKSAKTPAQDTVPKPATVRDKQDDPQGPSSKSKKSVVGKKSVTFAELPEPTTRKTAREPILLPAPQSSKDEPVANPSSISGQSQEPIRRPLRDTVIENFEETEHRQPTAAPKRKSFFRSTALDAKTGSSNEGAQSDSALHKTANSVRQRPSDVDSSSTSVSDSRLSKRNSERNKSVLYSVVERNVDDEGSKEADATLQTAALTGSAGNNDNHKSILDYDISAIENQGDDDDDHDDHGDDDDDEEDESGEYADSVDEVDVDSNLHMREVFLAYHAARTRVGAGPETGPLGGAHAVSDENWQQEEVPVDATAFNKPSEVSKMSRFRSGRLGPHAVNLPQIVLSGRTPGLDSSTSDLTDDEQRRLQSNLERLARGDEIA